MLGVEAGKRRGRPKLRWEGSVKRDLVGMGGEWRMKAPDGGVETVGGDSSEMGSVVKKGKKSMTGISTNLTPDVRDKEESNCWRATEQYLMTLTSTFYRISNQLVCMSVNIVQTCSFSLAALPTIHCTVHLYLRPVGYRVSRGVNCWWIVVCLQKCCRQRLTKSH